MSHTLDVSIVIVNWNVKDILHRCLESLYQYTHSITFEIFVIDNASSDGSVDMIRKNFPYVQLIANTENAGFGKAQNQGIQQARGKYICIFNPDTAITDNVFKKMFDWMENPEHTKVVLLGPKLMYPDGRPQPSIKRFPTAVSQMIILLKCHHVFGWFGPVRRYLAKDFDYNIEQPVDQMMGACIFARASALHALKGFDEDFWIWFEYVDLCKRSKASGWENWYTPLISIIHHEGKSFGQIFSPTKQRYFNASLKVYARKYYNAPSQIILAFLAPVSLFLSYIVSWLHIKPRPQSRV